MISCDSCLMAMLLMASIMIGSSDGLVCPGPVEEGSSVSLTCSFDTTTTVLVWQLEMSGKFKNVSSCQLNQICNNSMPPDFVADVGPTGKDITLTISRVNRNQTKFRCLNKICQLEVYVKPTTPVCNAGLGHYGKPYRSFLEMYCTTSSYPQAVCNVTSTLSRDLVASASPSYTYTQSEDGNVMTTCTYAKVLEGFQTGLHSLRFVVAPDLKMSVPNGAVVVERTVNIFAPSLSLGDDCPRGVIKTNMNATCTCHMTNSGYPEGWIKWYTSSNTPAGSMFVNAATTLQLIYNPNNPCPTYECSPESALGRLTPGLTFVPYFEENAGGCLKPKEIPISRENSSDISIGISAASGCVVIALILGAIVYFLIRSRRMRNNREKNTRNGSFSSSSATSTTYAIYPESQTYTGGTIPYDQLYTDRAMDGSSRANYAQVTMPSDSASTS